MERTRKMLYLPLAYHAALLVALAIMSAMGKMSSAYGFFLMLELCGVLVSPMFMALMGISHAILHDGKVFDYLKDGLIYLAIIGVMRVVLYVWQSPESALFACISAVISPAIFLLWEVIFAFTDKHMRNPRKRRKK